MREIRFSEQFEAFSSENLSTQRCVIRRKSNRRAAVRLGHEWIRKVNIELGSEQAEAHAAERVSFGEFDNQDIDLAERE